MTMGKGKIWWRESSGEAGCPAGRSQRVQPRFLALHQPVGNAAGDRQMSLTRATDRRKKMLYNHTLLL